MSRTGWASGFTLLELLVVTVLVSAMGTLGLGGLRTGLRVWERDGDVAEAEVEGLAVRRFLADLLAAAEPVAWGNTRPPELVFVGEPDRLSFVTTIPSERLRGTAALVSLYVADGALRLGWQPIGDRRPELSAMTDEELLLDGVAALRIRYDATSELTRPTALPRAIHLDLDMRDPGSAWPTLTAAPLSGRTF